MGLFSDLARQVGILRAALGEDLDASACLEKLLRVDDDIVIEILHAASAVVKAGEVLRIAAAGVAASRSPRESGHGGLAQARGHRSPVALVQEITGSTRADAAKHVRLGQALLDAGGLTAEELNLDHSLPPHSAHPRTPEPTTTPRTKRPWHAALSDAMMQGIITSAQHDAIYRGLGRLPGDDDLSSSIGNGCSGESDSEGGRTCPECEGTTMRDAWAAAAQQLVDEAPARTVEELGRAARTLRDLLDPEGAQRRFDERFEGRAFRTWTDADGIHHGSIRFDDLGYAWLRAIQDTALRPRRGGPRFVDPDEQAKADKLVDDPRTNDQLSYDLLLDTLRTGSLADAAAVFGTRQAGVRVVVTEHTLLGTVERTGSGQSSSEDSPQAPGIALLEDGGMLPAWLAGQQACSIGTLACTVDRKGNPLFLGREARTFSSKQNIALAIRDGGCRWPGCDRPPSYSEAHHIDRWSDGGCTDIDRGILLCRFHHMNLHHRGWRITRHGSGPFRLHPPGDAEAIVLSPPIERRYAYGDLQPPSTPLRPAA